MDIPRLPPTAFGSCQAIMGGFFYDLLAGAALNEQTLDRDLLFKFVNVYRDGEANSTLNIVQLIGMQSHTNQGVEFDPITEDNAFAAACHRPDLVDETIIRGFTNAQLGILIRYQPQFVELVDFDSLSVDSRFNIARIRPEFIDRCKLSDEQLYSLHYKP